MATIKIILRAGKPRNPIAQLAKQKNAGRHGAYREERRLRRTGKQALKQELKGSGWKGDGGA